MATAIERPRDALPTWPVASGSLLLGFAVAQATGVRPLGGVVLALGATWCGLRWLRSVGRARTAGLVAVYVGVFVLSHVIADAVGTWPAVVLAAAIAGLAALVVADIPAARGATAA
ncbi:MAG: hypothetical protein QOE31_3345 [Solirubrobacteraceae bacterium]|jgi:hypothetical protein|nr:hypothetical protein [Solirubrobacteraceae bacterium]